MAGRRWPSHLRVHCWGLDSSAFLYAFRVRCRRRSWRPAHVQYVALQARQLCICFMNSLCVTVSLTFDITCVPSFLLACVTKELEASVTQAKIVAVKSRRNHAARFPSSPTGAADSEKALRQSTAERIHQLLSTADYVLGALRSCAEEPCE